MPENSFFFNEQIFKRLISRCWKRNCLKIEWRSWTFYDFFLRTFINYILWPPTFIFYSWRRTVSNAPDSTSLFSIGDAVRVGTSEDKVYMKKISHFCRWGSRKFQKFEHLQIRRKGSLAHDIFLAFFNCYPFYL